MQEQLLRDVTAEEIATYERDGVVCLRGLLAPAWIARLGRGIDRALYEQWGTGGAPVSDQTREAEKLRAAGHTILSDAKAEAIPEAKRGHFLSMIGAWMINEDIRACALQAPLGYVAGQLFGAGKVNFYDDQTMVKEAGTKEYTAFHTDEPYYHLRGDQVCGIWISPDVVTEDSGAMRYVRGSHRWPGVFKPNAFVSQVSRGQSKDATAEDETQVQLPDIEGNEGTYDIVTYTSNPGDVIVHHSRLVHGSRPNYRADRPRRAVSLRYIGDDVRYHFHKSAPPQSHHRHSLVDGDALDSDQFPVVWRKREDSPLRV